MQVTSFILAATTVLGAGAACGSDDQEDTTTTDQEAVVAPTPYVGFSDATVGGTAGFILYSPWGSATPPLTGTFQNFGTTRVKMKLLNLTSCTTTGSGPVEGSLIATLPTSVAPTAIPPSYKSQANTLQFNLIAGNCYRVVPTLDGFDLGFSDFQVTSAKAVVPYKKMSPGANLVVTFRLETALATDTDSDGVPDWRDNCVNVANADQADSNANGIGNACEVVDNCPSDPSKTAPGLCGCGFSDADTDGDGQADGPGGLDATAACGDVCPANATKTTNAGSCGCGVNAPEADTDGDTFPNCVDFCATDATKHLESETTGPTRCGCGTADTDSDVDGFANCNETCTADPFKQNAGPCGCGVFEIDLDHNGATDSCANSCTPI